MFQQTIKMTAYQTKTNCDIPKQKSRHTSKKRCVHTFEKNNQSSILVKVPRNKVCNQLLKSDIVNDHVSTNNKDVSIPKKDVDIPPKKDVDIPQKKDVDIPSKNNNQYCSISNFNINIP